MGKRDQAKEQHWRGVLAEFAASGLSGRAFCAQHEISENLFHSWKRELRIRDQESQQAVAPKPLLPVEVVADTRPSSRIEIILEDVLRVSVEPGFDPATLQLVLRVLERREC